MNDVMIDPFWLRIGVATAFLLFAGAVMSFMRFIHPNRALKPLAVVACLVSLYAGSKGFGPSVSWPAGVVNDGSCFDTNAWQWVELRWKLQRDFPRDVPLTIDAKPKSGDWFNLDVCQSGLLTNRIDLTGLSDHPTNYIFRVTSEYTPGTVEIKDFSAKAATTEMAVVCRWTSPTNLVGLVGRIQYRMHEPPGSTWTHGLNVVIGRTNEVYVAGNFVNRRIDRDFRLVVDGYSPFVLINRTDAQLRKRYIIQRLNLQFFILPGIRREMKMLGPESLKGVRL